MTRERRPFYRVMWAKTMNPVGMYQSVGDLEVAKRIALDARRAYSDSALDLTFEIQDMSQWGEGRTGTVLILTHAGEWKEPTA